MRSIPEEDFQSSISRVEREMESGSIEWAFVFRRTGSE
jgi:hypothetical protein